MNTPAQHHTRRQILTRVESTIHELEREVCQVCRGTGADQVCHVLVQPCPVCDGTGSVLVKVKEAA